MFHQTIDLYSSLSFLLKIYLEKVTYNDIPPYYMDTFVEIQSTQRYDNLSFNSYVICFSFPSSVYSTPCPRNIASR